MTFPYPINTSIPATGHFPGNDQPLMQVNFANINGYLGVDHVLPNTNPGAGFHKQVTFNSANPPSVPTVPPVLFTNTQDGAAVPNTLPGGIAGLFFYSGSLTQGQRQNVVATSGSIVLFGNIILKWGSVSLGNQNGNNVVNFPQAFPNNVFNVQITGQRDNSASIATLYVNSHAGLTPTVNGFNITSVSASGSWSNVFYIAIGN